MKPDAPIHRDDVYPCGVNANVLDNPHNFQSRVKPSKLFWAVALDSAALLVSIKQSLVTDPTDQAHFRCLRSHQPHPESTDDSQTLSKNGDFFLFKRTLYVPDHTEVHLDVLISYCDHHLTGQPGIGKTGSENFSHSNPHHQNVQLAFLSFFFLLLCVFFCYHTIPVPHISYTTP